MEHRTNVTKKTSHKQNKTQKPAWLIYTFLTILLTINTFFVFSLKTTNNKQNTQINSLKKEIKQQRHSFLNQQSQALEKISKQTYSPPLLNLINGQVANPLKIYPGPKYIVNITELGCDVCLEEEVRIAQDLKNQNPDFPIFVIIHSNERRYAMALIRQMQLTLPVFYDQEGEFTKKNLLAKNPSVLLLDNENKIIYLHNPIPGDNQFSVNFRSFTESFVTLAI